MATFGCFKRIAVFSSNSTDSIRARIELHSGKKKEVKRKRRIGKRGGCVGRVVLCPRNLESRRRE